MKITPQNKTYQKFRLVTRSDMDGLVSAILLRELDLIDDILFVHPKDMQDGNVLVSERDIITNLPYVPGVHMVFDNHASEKERNAQMHQFINIENHIVDVNAPSSTRVVYNYFGGKEQFNNIPYDLIEMVDRADSAQFTEQEILNPVGWPLLCFIMDERTGLGRYHHFTISNYQLMMALIEHCRAHKTADQILEIPDVEERVRLYHLHKESAREQIIRCTKLYGNVAVLDLRNETQVFCTNRFMIYTLFPEVNVSIHLFWGRGRKNTVFAVGKSIFNRTCPIHIGKLMLKYDGGGQEAAGTCQVDHSMTEETLEQLLNTLAGE